VVAALTEANYRLEKQLEDKSADLRELKASTPQPEITVGLMYTKLVALA
jgi:hypothetical protein